MTWVYVWMCMEFQCPCSTPLRIIWMISSDKCSTFYAVLNAHLSYLNDRWKHTIRVKLHFGHWTFYISRFTNSRPKVFQTTCAHMRICDRRPFSSSSLVISNRAHKHLSNAAKDISKEILQSNDLVLKLSWVATCFGASTGHLLVSRSLLIINCPPNAVNVFLVHIPFTHTLYFWSPFQAIGTISWERWNSRSDVEGQCGQGQNIRVQPRDAILWSNITTTIETNFRSDVSKRCLLI